MKWVVTVTVKIDSVTRRFFAFHLDANEDLLEQRLKEHTKGLLESEGLEKYTDIRIMAEPEEQLCYILRGTGPDDKGNWYESL